MGREGEVKGPDLFKDRWDAWHVWHAGFFHSLPNLQKGWPTPVASVFFPLVPALCILEFIPLYWGWSPERTQKTGPKANGFLYFHFLELCYLILTHTLNNFFFPLKLTFIFGLHKNTICLSPTSLKLLLWPQLWLDAFIITWPISLVSLELKPCSQSLNHTNYFHI